jgi:hypothetical protein
MSTAASPGLCRFFHFLRGHSIVARKGKSLVAGRRPECRQKVLTPSLLGTGNRCRLQEEEEEEEEEEE